MKNKLIFIYIAAYLLNTNFKIKTLMKRLIIISFTSFFLCLVIASCKNKVESKDQYKEYVIRNISNTLSDTLIYDTHKSISYIEIIITGNIKGRASIDFDNGSGRFKKVVLNNQIDIKYQTDWYSPKMYFRYSPESNISGDSIKLTYKMY